MRKRLLMAAALTGVIGLAFLFPGTRWRAWGLLHGESFYHGLPTSYWRMEITRYCSGPYNPPPPTALFCG